MFLYDHLSEARDERGNRKHETACFYFTTAGARAERIKIATANLADAFRVMGERFADLIIAADRDGPT